MKRGVNSPVFVLEKGNQRGIGIVYIGDPAYSKG